jgi:hypothetical protein
MHLQSLLTTTGLHRSALDEVFPVYTRETRTQMRLDLCKINLVGGEILLQQALQRTTKSTFAPC